MTNSQSPSNRLTRPRNGRMIAGVAAAIASRMDLDVTVVRLLFVVSLFFGGLGFWVYLAGWALIPEEGQSQSAAERMFGNN
ncbi:MAG TPA: PspC domain-containing protein [Acidimicrobiia bacterium]|nr:PspC domain-containing protein [Acidimicrobiia bacterium]